jgi:glycosyltransferase involved in cell wall biosynthesis
MISICMTTYNRAPQLSRTLASIFKQQVQDLQVEVIVVDDGTDTETKTLCDSYNVKYFKLDRPPSTTYRDVGRPMNIAIRQSIGDIVILQNAECMHMDPNTIEKLTSQVTDRNVVFSKTTSLYPDGSFHSLYVGKDLQRPFFFCGAIKRIILERLRGFDEEYPGSGYEDNDFAARLARENIEFVFTDIEVHHQWHERAGALHINAAQAMYYQKCADMDTGKLGVVRNLSGIWGQL